MEDTTKKYIKMENVLNKINQKYIALPDYEVKRNNRIVDQVVGKILAAMKKQSPLFKTMFERQFYGGSFYDGIKVGKPIEFDLDFVLNLPVLIKPVVEVGDKPGFVQVHIMEYDKLVNQPDQYSKYLDMKKTLFDDKMYLSTDKVLSWMEKTVDKALNYLGKLKDGTVLFNVKLSDKTLVMYAIVKKCHPAFTLKLTSEDGSIKLDIDLVPCFQFNNDQWPKGKYKRNPYPVRRDKFLVVPKRPKGQFQNIDRYWRLSFQEQERELISGCQNLTLKPALRLLKKLRDKHSHAIASYHIKTVFLWHVSENPPEIWRQPLSVIFMMMLKKYEEMMKNKRIPYYWNEHFNMIGHIQDVTKIGIANTLRNIINAIDRYVDEDPFVVAKYLIDQHEIEELRSEPDLLGKKVLKKISSISKSASQLSLPSILDKASVFSELATHVAMSLNNSAASKIDIAELLRNLGASNFDRATVTSSDKGSTIKSTSEAGGSNGNQNLTVETSSNSLSNSSSQMSDESSNSLSNNIVNNESFDADVESVDSNCFVYSLGQISEESNIKTISDCDSLGTQAEVETRHRLSNHGVYNELSGGDVESSSGIGSAAEEINNLDSIKDDKNSTQKPSEISDDGFESGNSNEACYVSDNVNKEVEICIFDKNIYIALEKLNDKTDAMSNVLKGLERGQEELFKLCSRLTEKVQLLEDRVDIIDHNVNATSKYIPRQRIPHDSCMDPPYEDVTTDSRAGNIKESLEQLNKKTDSVFDGMKILQEVNEKLVMICQPLSEKVQTLEIKIDNLNKNVKPEMNSNLEDLLLFGATLPNSSLTNDTAVFQSDVFTGGY
nr:unnamed protein product [Callosobruchus analis]